MENVIFDIIGAFVGALPCLLVLRIIFDLLRELIFKW